MKRGKAKYLRALIERLTATLDDSEALTGVELFPAWQVGKSYIVGDRIRYNDVLYKVIQEHTSQEDWTPEVAVSLFSKVLISDPTIIPEWEHPNSTNPYKKGDKVAHNGLTWISIIDNNVWEPGVYGWTKV